MRGKGRGGRATYEEQVGEAFVVQVEVSVGAIDEDRERLLLIR